MKTVVSSARESWKGPEAAQNHISAPAGRPGAKVPGTLLGCRGSLNGVGGGPDQLWCVVVFAQAPAAVGGLGEQHPGPPDQRWAGGDIGQLLDTASCLRWPSVPALVRQLASWCLSANVRALGLRAVERHKVVRLVRSA